MTEALVYIVTVGGVVNVVLQWVFVLRGRDGHIRSS